MSYILDALRKSERERDQGAVAVLRTPPPLSNRRRRPTRGFLLGLLLIVSAAAVIWLAGPGLLEKARQVSIGVAGLAEVPDKAPASALAPAGGDGIPDRKVDKLATAPAPPADERGKIRHDEPAAALPAGVRDLTLNVVSYSEAPERRFAMINQRIVRESDRIAAGIQVKRIRPGGVILAVGGDEVLLRPE